MESATTNQSYIQIDAAKRGSQGESFAGGKNRPVLALVIPALRAIENLPGVLKRAQCALARTGIQYEILVVDDDSRDGTEELVTGLAEEDTRIRLLVRRAKRGLSGAILDGWRHSDAPILGVMDADGQHPPELLPALIAAMLGGGNDNELDLAVGSRFTAGSLRSGWHPLRKSMSALALWAARPLQPAHVRIADPLSGFFLVRRACVENIAFQPTGFKLLLEVLNRGRIRSVREIPFVFGRRTAGSSKVSLKVSWDYLRLLARLYRRQDRDVKRLSEGTGGSLAGERARNRQICDFDA